MTKIFMINERTWTNGDLVVHTENKDLENAIPTGRMLTDSDQLSFIYILELNGEYTYLAFTSDLWTDLKKIIDGNGKVFLGKVELVEMVNELTYLISNIEGNGNYGVEMVNKVEEIFLK